MAPMNKFYFGKTLVMAEKRCTFILTTDNLNQPNSHWKAWVDLALKLKTPKEWVKRNFGFQT